MPGASSSKKVARAAGTGGGRTNRGRTPWVYYSVLALVVVLGLTGIVASRDRRLAQINTQGNVPPLAGKADWHEAYAVYICGKFLPVITSTNDPAGINTEGDGVIYIHPFTEASAGKNATLAEFASAVGMTLNAGELQAPGQHAYFDNDKCAGKPGLVQVQQFANPQDKTGFQEAIDPKNVLLADKAMVTIAFMPRHAKIPPPPASVIASLAHPKNIPITQGGKPPVTTVAPASVPASGTTTPAASTTAPVSASSSSSTTAAPPSSTTTNNS